MKRALPAFALLLAACQPGSNANDGAAQSDAARDGALVYPTQAPPGGVLLTTPDMVIPAGAEKMFCTYTNVTVTTDPGMLLREIHSYQQQYGHHIALFYTDEAQPVDTHECTEADMSRMRLVGAGNESAELRFDLPDGVTLQVPRGGQLVLQSHYVNLSQQDIHVHDALTAAPPPAGQDLQIAGAYAFNDGDFIIPPRAAAYGRSMECALPNLMNVVNLFGHMHQYSTRVRILRQPVGTTTWETLYDESGANERLRNAPPIHSYPLGVGPVLQTGDRIRVSCDWNNTTDHEITYPEEMCSAVVYYYPYQGFGVCDTVVETRGGVDGGAADAGSDAATHTVTCTDPTEVGNERGVGHYCTLGGGECNSAHGSVICTADATGDPTGFCTRPCSTSDICGYSAHCEGDSRGMGCVPNSCNDPAPDAGAVDGGSAPDASSPMDAGSSG